MTRWLQTSCSTHHPSESSLSHGLCEWSPELRSDDPSTHLCCLQPLGFIDSLCPACKSGNRTARNIDEKVARKDETSKQTNVKLAPKGTHLVLPKTVRSFIAIGDPGLLVVIGNEWIVIWKPRWSPNPNQLDHSGETSLSRITDCASGARSCVPTTHQLTLAFGGELAAFCPLEWFIDSLCPCFLPLKLARVDEKVSRKRWNKKTNEEEIG